jgi:hypothetical protein
MNARAIALLSVALSGCGGCNGTKSKGAELKPFEPKPVDGRFITPTGSSTGTMHTRRDPFPDQDLSKMKAPAGRRWGAGPPTVYLDGAPIAVLAYGDLPPSLRPEFQDFDGEKIRRYDFPDYFRALGLDLDKIQEIHLVHGPGRISIIKGAELKKEGHPLRFAFSQGTRGRARVFYGKGVETNDKIDMVSYACVYQEKKPPKLNYDKDLELDGVVIDGVPYARGREVRNGVRVYVDGRLKGLLKRNQLRETLRVKTSTGGPPRYELLPTLKALGAEFTPTATIDIIDDDKTVDRLTADRLADASFYAMDGGGGMIGLLPLHKTASVIQVYVSSPPPVLSER